MYLTMKKRNSPYSSLFKSKKKTISESSMHVTLRSPLWAGRETGRCYSLRFKQDTIHSKRWGSSMWE